MHSESGQDVTMELTSITRVQPSSSHQKPLTLPSDLADSPSQEQTMQEQENKRQRIIWSIKAEPETQIKSNFPET